MVATTVDPLAEVWAAWWVGARVGLLAARMVDTWVEMKVVWTVVVMVESRGVQMVESLVALTAE